MWGESSVRLTIGGVGGVVALDSTRLERASASTKLAEAFLALGVSAREERNTLLGRDATDTGLDGPAGRGDALP